MTTTYIQKGIFYTMYNENGKVQTHTYPIIPRPALNIVNSEHMRVMFPYFGDMLGTYTIIDNTLIIMNTMINNSYTTREAFTMIIFS